MSRTNWMWASSPRWESTHLKTHGWACVYRVNRKQKTMRQVNMSPSVWCYFKTSSVSLCFVFINVHLPAAHFFPLLYYPCTNTFVYRAVLLNAKGKAIACKISGLIMNGYKSKPLFVMCPDVWWRHIGLKIAGSWQMALCSAPFRGPSRRKRGGAGSYNTALSLLATWEGYEWRVIVDCFKWWWVPSLCRK